MDTHTTGITFEHIGIGTVLKRHLLEVPLNQREYSWEDEHVRDLFQDLANAIDTRKETYFLGTIVLTFGKRGKSEVTDGQQRLATTMILLAAIRDYLHTRKETELVKSIENDFLTAFVRESRSNVPRITLNVDDNEFFRKYIVASPDSPERNTTPTKTSHKRIAAASKLAKKHIRAILEALSDKHHIDRLNDWIRYLEDNFQVIVLHVPDQMNAFVMFETLNDRGLKTSQADLLKNYLFGESEDRIAEAQQKWASMAGSLETIGSDEIVMDYLRHLLITQRGPTRERDVYDRIRDRVGGQTKAIAFVDTLAESSNDYVAIQNWSHTKWNAYPDSVRNHVRTLVELRAKQIRPLMLAIVRKFSEQEAAKAFKLFVSWAVRFLVCGGAGSGSLEEAYGRTALAVTEGKHDRARDLPSSMGDLIPTDAEFDTGFSTANVSQHYLARYYLRAIESKLKQQPHPEWLPNEDKNVITLEHVLPQHPDNSWPVTDREIAEAFHKRIGNLALLPATVNADLGNAQFPEKKAAFAQSGYITTCEIAECASWGIKEINDRQRKLARHAVETWSLNL